MKAHIDIEMFVKERNEALCSFDEGKIRAYCKKYGAKCPEKGYLDDKPFWGGVAKAVLHIEDAPEEAQKKARRILKRYGMRETIFGYDN